MEIMLDKKQIWVIFLFKFEMGCRAVETTFNINNAFDPGTVNECTVIVQEVLQRRREPWRLRSVVASHQKLTMTNWERHWSWSSYNYMRSCEGLSVNHSMVVQHLKQIGKVKKLDKLLPHELMENQRIVVLKCCSLLFYTTTRNHFSIELWHAIKSGFHMTTSNDQLCGWTRKKLQSTSQS